MLAEKVGQAHGQVHRLSEQAAESSQSARLLLRCMAETDSDDDVAVNYSHKSEMKFHLEP